MATNLDPQQLGLGGAVLGGQLLLCGSNTQRYNMGMGPLGDPNIEPKRRFRFLFEVSFCNGTKTVPPYFVKMAARPDLSIEETELNFLNSKTWITGKPSWEQISVTYMDISTGDNFELWSWIGTVYNFFSTGNGSSAAQSAPCYSMGRRSDYEGIGKLQILDGCGFPTEAWVMGNMWPTSIKFGEVDYSQSETLDIEMQLRYSNVQYRSFCGPQPNPCPCTPCGNPPTVTEERNQ